MKERSQLNDRLPSQTLTYLATSCEPWSLFQHKWQGNKRCYKILLRPQLSSIQSSQEQIEKYRDKKQTEGLKTTGRKNAAVTHIEAGWLTTTILKCFLISLSVGPERTENQLVKQQVLNTRWLLAETIVDNFRALAVPSLAKKMKVPTETAFAR